MTTRWTIAALACAGLSSAACTPQHPSVAPTWTEPALHTATAELRTQSLQLSLGATSGGADRWRDELRATLTELRPLAVAVTAQDPAGRDAVLRETRRLLPRAASVEGHLSTSVPRGAAIVHLTYAAATVAGCPDWSAPTPAVPRIGSNFGCATAQNLAATVVQPGDLMGVGELGPADGTREAKAVERYRADEVEEPSVDGASP